METSARDVFMRHTDADGRSHVFCHRVWISDSDALERFLRRKQDEVREMNTRAHLDGKPELARSEQITEEQYKANRSKK
jgi:hypothetical protein